MPHAWPRRIVPAGLVTMLGGLVVFGALSANPPADAYVGMPSSYRAYWQWVSTTAAAPEASMAEGLSDLSGDPNFAWRYTRLADLCVAQEQQATCLQAFTQAQPTSAVARQHRQAAVAMTATSPEAASGAWSALAAMPHLDPALVRRLVEAAPATVAALEARLAQDSTDAGAAFAVALTRLAQNDFDGAEKLLLQAQRRSPDAADVYRELGRIYFMQGRVDRQAEVLREGVSRADAAFSLESSLLLRGNLGLALMKQQDGLSEAQATFREATDRWATLGDRGRVGLSRYRLGLVALQQQHYVEALAFADSALADLRAAKSPNLPDALTLRGTAQLSLFRFSDAQGSLRAAVSAAEAAPQTPQARFSKLQAAVSLAQVNSWTGHYGKVRTEALASIAEAQELGLADIEIGLRMVLGEAERFSGNLDQAVQQYNTALGIAKRLGQQTQEVDLYERLGAVMLEMQDPVSAKSYFEDASLNEGADAWVLAGFGRIYYQFGNYDQALNYFDRSLRKANQSDITLRTTLATHKGWALIQSRRYREAAHLLDLTLEATPLNPTSSRLNLLVARATVANDLEEYDSALAFVAQARQIRQKLELPSIDWILDVTAALAYWKTGNARQAEHHYQRSINTIEALRENLYSVQKRAAFVGDKGQVYKQFVAFLMSQGRPSEAFYIAERARARSLADLLVTMRTEAPAGSDAARLLELQRRREAIDQALVDEYGPVRAGDAVRSASLRREQWNTIQQYQEAQQRLASDQTYAAVSKAASQASTQQILKPGEALVSFSLGRSAGAATEIPSVAYVFTRDRVQTVELEVNHEELTETIRFFRSSINRANGAPRSGWEGAARRLYTDLMAPVVRALPANTSHLNLIPEGMLNYVPFAALLDPQGRFLVERFTLSSAPSASVLALARQRAEEVGDRWRQVVAVGDPNGRLPGTRDEVNALASLKGLRLTRLIGAQATKQTLVGVARSADILHLATHGRFVSRSPWNSYLELNGSVLRVGDIEQLRLDRPYLVTLSACETALGSGLASDIPAGEEWVGLNQAFLAAGAPSVLASLWAIDDRASSTFMVDFYRHLLEGKGKAWALAQVQQQYLHNPRYRHPFYWAAFTLTGEPS